MIEAARKFAERLERRIAQLEAIDEPSERQEAQLAACEDLAAAVEDFIAEYEGA